jgi:hypothetical protein
MAPSSPPDTSNRSSSAGSACNGCHRRLVMPPSWAGMDRRLPDASQILSHEQDVSADRPSDVRSIVQLTSM